MREVGPGPSAAARVFVAVTIAVAAIGGVVLIALSMWGVRVRTGALLGLLAGLACFIPTLSWSGIFVGRFPWFALATTEALYLALMGAVLAWLQGPLVRSGRALPAALLVPVLWVLQELVRSSLPYGGFPWARIAFSQADSPLARWAALGGAPLITFVVALVAVPFILLVVTRRLPVTALVLAVAQAKGLEQLTVLVLGGNNLNLEVHLVAEQHQGFIRHRRGGSHHFAEVEQSLHELRGIRANLVGKVRK